MSPAVSIYNPAELGAPLGPYSQVARVKTNELLFIAGMVAVDANGQLVGDRIARRAPAFTPGVQSVLGSRCTAEGSQ